MNKASSSIFLIFGLTRPGIEPRYPGPFDGHLTHYAHGQVYISAPYEHWNWKLFRGPARDDGC